MQMKNQAVVVLLVVCQLVTHNAVMSKLKKSKLILQKKSKLILQTSPPLVR